MEATKVTEQSQDSRHENSSLGERYGKIGISAVAGALHHQCAWRNTYATLNLSRVSS